MIHTLDGVSVSLDHPLVSLLDPSIDHCEVGVFETLRSYGKKLSFVHEHLERLASSASLVGLSLPCSLATIRSYMEDAFVKFDGDPVRLKVVVTAAHVIVQVRLLEIDRSIYDGVGVLSVPMARKNPLAKSLDYHDCYRAHQKALDGECFDALLVDGLGLVREGAYANVFWVKDRILYTSREGVLEGITREKIMSLHETQFMDISLEDLKKVDEVFLTQTTTGIVPVTEIDGVRIGNGDVGTVTQQLMDAYNVLVI